MAKTISNKLENEIIDACASAERAILLLGKKIDYLQLKVAKLELEKEQLKAVLKSCSGLLNTYGKFPETNKMIRDALDL